MIIESIFIELFVMRFCLIIRNNKVHIIATMTAFIVFNAPFTYLLLINFFINLLQNPSACIADGFCILNIISNVIADLLT